MKRAFDLALTALLAPWAGVVVLFATLAIKLTSRGPVIHMSSRVGKNRVIFQMPKLRTMWIDTPQVATHKLADPGKRLTPVGSFLRKFSVDELPQLWSVLKGDMSFVGPRPALFNQDDLVALREEKGVNALTPGITGWAQINGRDEVSIPDKVALDEYYLRHRSFWLDIKIIVLTLFSALAAKGVTH